MYESHNEGSPEIEAMEEKVFGENYEQVEEVHQYSEANSWVHPAIGIILLILIIIGIVIFLRRKK